MASNIQPATGRRVAEAIAKANVTVTDCLISCSLNRDAMGAHLLSICPEVMHLLFGLRKSAVSPVVSGGHWAIFKPRIPSVSRLGALNSGQFETHALAKLMQLELPLAPELPPLSPVVAKAISDANKVVYEAYVVCSEERDPIAPMLLGTGPGMAYCDEMAQISKGKILAAFAQTRFPIFSLRHNSVEVMKSIIDHGFTRPIFLREMLLDSSFA